MPPACAHPTQDKSLIPLPPIAAQGHGRMTVKTIFTTCWRQAGRRWRVVTSCNTIGIEPVNSSAFPMGRQS
jgi:hypothetical protein